MKEINHENRIEFPLYRSDVGNYSFVYNQFGIVKGNSMDLDIIQPLWEQLNSLHFSQSTHFSDRYLKMNWQQRKQQIIEKSEEVQLAYAVQTEKKHIVGYCISSINKLDSREGEIESIFIAESYRQSGLGKVLFEDAIQWLDNNNITTQRLLISVGNEQVLDFYSQFGFRPLHLVLQKTNSEP